MPDPVIDKTWRVVDESGLTVAFRCTRENAEEMARNHNYNIWLEKRWS